MVEEKENEIEVVESDEAEENETKENDSQNENAESANETTRRITWAKKVTKRPKQ